MFGTAGPKPAGQGNRLAAAWQRPFAFSPALRFSLLVDGRDEHLERDGAEAPSRGVAVALSLCSPGLGQFYLGQTLRALAWAALPLLSFSAFQWLVMRVPALYGMYLPAAAGTFLGAHALGVLDVLLVPAARLRQARWLQVGMFWVGMVVFAIVAAVLLRSFVVEAFKVPSGGMQPTLGIQDHMLVDKGAFRGQLPARGNLAVFTSPERPMYDFVQRVVAVPGDRLEVVDGRPWLNGSEVPHCVVGKASFDDRPGVVGQLELEYLGAAPFLIFLEEGNPSGRQGPFVVKPGEVWVLGDNRSNSVDSRFWFGGRGGGVPAENLRGRPLFTWLAFKPDGHAEWSRMGVSLDEPRLPPDLQALAPALRACLAKR